MITFYHARFAILCEMLTILRTIIDAIFPPRPETLLVRALTAQVMQSQSVPSRYRELHYLYDYQSPTIRALIHENKYYKNKTAARLLAVGLADWLATLARAQSAPILLVPIPLSQKRHRERGYNQVLEILNALPPLPGVQRDDRLLTRPIHTPSQTALTRSERLKNVTGAFHTTPADYRRYSGRTMVIIDDVVTTGSTLMAARATLARQLPRDCRIILLALAH